jgi:putative nucleotidyltransferase with HDIG domain
MQGFPAARGGYDSRSAKGLRPTPDHAAAKCARDVKCQTVGDDRVRGTIPAGEYRVMHHAIPTHHAEASGSVARPPVRSARRLFPGIRSLLRSTRLDSTHALLAAVDAKDSYTRRHSLTVSAYAGAIAGRMGVKASARRELMTAALLHDIGKIGIPDRILNKSEALTPAEFQIMKRHPRLAVEILSPMRDLNGQRRIILHHHERYDGRGYPSGLCGEDIPLGSRILAIADAIDAMMSRRPYKASMTKAEVRAELVVQAGVQFDPAVVSVAIGWLDENGHIRARHGEDPARACPT